MTEEKVLFWEQTVGEILAQCTYQKGLYTMTLTKGDIIKTESWKQSFTPTFGMDVADQRKSLEVAEKLAQEIDKLAEASKEVK